MTAILAICATIWAVLAWVGHLVSALCALLQPTLAKRRAKNPNLPPVSILIPVHLDEPSLVTCLESAFTQDYPQFEVVIAAKDASSLVIDIVRRVMARYPHVPSAIAVGTEAFAASPKVDNLAGALVVARHGLLLQQDANILLQPGQLRRLVAEMADGIGLVVAVPIGIDAEGVAAKIERSFLNEYHVRWLLAGSAVGQGFGIGKLMLVRRSALEQAGGLKAIAHTVGEDHALALALEQVDAKTIISGEVGIQIIGRRDPVSVWERQLRWMILRRVENRAAFAGEIIFNGSVAALMVGIAASGAGASFLPYFALSLFVWIGVEGVFLALKDWPRSKTTPLAILARDLMVPFVWFAALFRKSVTWRGQRLPVRPD
jgi:ceramide glucosyltransferase